MQLQDEHITPVEELEDGTTIYEIGPDNEEQISNNDFYANLAEELSESSRNKLSTYLLEQIDEDIEARKDWLDSVNRVTPTMHKNLILPVDLKTVYQF